MTAENADARPPTQQIQPGSTGQIIIPSSVPKERPTKSIVISGQSTSPHATAKTIIPAPKKKPRRPPSAQLYTRRIHLILLVLVLLIGAGYAGVLYLKPNSAPTPLPTQTSSNDMPETVIAHTSNDSDTIADHNNHQLGSLITLKTTALDYSSTELDNPERGPQYYGDEAPPSGWPLTDRYQRWCWSEIEPSLGQFNFALIDQQLAQAAAAGYTFGFRIMPTNPGPCLPNGLAFNYNSPQYLSAAQTFFTALGQRYNNDPRLGWLDISLYGCYGEWNQSESACNQSMSAINRQHLIDIQVQALSNKRFLMLTDAQDSLDYALNLQRAQPIGVRIDCLGQQGLGGALDTLKNDPLVSNRWRVAPLYFEYCSNPDFQQALADIKNYHASIIGDGASNIGSYSSYSSQQQALMLQNYKISGYRFTLDSLQLPSRLVPGDQFPVSTHWSNLNIAPAYHGWNVMVQLRDTAGHVAWQSKSSTDLRTLFSDNPITTTDQFTLPPTLAPGTYKVAVQVLDQAGYYHPLKLSIQGAQNDNSYILGSTTVLG